MRLQSLTITRQESWEKESGQLKAKATFSGPGGTLEIDLAPGFIVNVINLIAEDAAKKAKRVASAVPSAIEDAQADAKLLGIDAESPALVA